MRNINIASQTLTDDGVIYLNPLDFLDGIYEGSILFTVTGTKVTGTFSASAQLQGSNSSNFSTGVVNLGSPVVMADTVTSEISLNNTEKLKYAYYRVEITGSGTQSTEITGTYTRKGVS